MTLKLNQFNFSVIDAAATRVAARQRAVCERGFYPVTKQKKKRFGNLIDSEFCFHMKK